MHNIAELQIAVLFSKSRKGTSQMSNNDEGICQSTFVKLMHLTIVWLLNAPIYL